MRVICVTSTHQVLHLRADVVDLPTIELLEHLLLIGQVCDCGSPLILGLDIAVAQVVVVTGLPGVPVAVDERDVWTLRDVHLLLIVVSF